MPDVFRPGMGDEWSDIGDLLELLQKRPGWWADALCPEYPDVDFFATSAKKVQEAKDVCGRCLVIFECRQWASQQGADLHGVFGGQTQRERNRLRREQRAA